MSNVIHYQGRAEVTIPPGEKIAVFTKGKASVSLSLTLPNYPTSVSLIGVVNNQETVFGAYASGALVIIENSDSSDIYYAVGVAPFCTERLLSPYQATPIAKTTAVTLTGGELLLGIITATHAAGATVAYTLPTGANMDLATELVIDQSFEWALINLSAAATDTVTVTANTGHTIVGNTIVQSANAATGLLYGSSAYFRTRKTAADTFISYRIA